MTEILRRKSILQVPRTKTIDIEFENIFYTVKQGRKGKKQIIKGVSGKFKSGELTAIMGPSGAGKTSLLNILTGFQVTGTEGTIKCNKNVGNTKKLQYKKHSSYILQDDNLAPYFTVEEIMKMATDLKIGASVSAKSKEFLIDDILDRLSLLAAKQTRCGRLSGGQKKRLSIALELIDNPTVMFLDEPTTGLDSSSSSQCIQMLKSLAAGGRTIICTIHQPSATLYELFDHVYAMADGHCIYQGDTSNTVAYLSSVGYNCPQYHNPADYLLEVANGEYGNSTEILSNAAKDTCWTSSNLKESVEDKSVSEQLLYDDTLLLTNFDSSESASPSEWSRFCILLNRSLLQMYRDWTISHLKIALHLMVGTFLGLTYLNFGNDASKSINNIGLLIVSAVYLIYTSLMPAVLKFPSEMAVLRKERFNNWYKLSTYYFAFLVADIPLQILFSIVYTVTSYVLSSQPYEWTRYLMVQLILALVALIASSMGFVLGTTVNPINGTFLGAILTALMLVVAGFLILFTQMSRTMYLLSYVSYISFAMEGMVQAIYGSNRGPLTCPDDIEYCHYRSPSLLLREFGMDKDNYWVDVGYLVINFVVLRFVAYFSLKKRLSAA